MAIGQLAAGGRRPGDLFIFIVIGSSIDRTDVFDTSLPKTSNIDVFAKDVEY